MKKPGSKSTPRKCAAQSRPAKPCREVPERNHARSQTWTGPNLRGLVDETRQPEMVNVWQDATAYIETVKRAYRRDNWQDQPRYCEVWSEKGTILGAIRPIADKWGVMLRVCHGFSSTGMEGQVGSMFEVVGKDITVYYLGDHDPSGHVIEQDIHRRAQLASGGNFQMVRLAIHAADIAAFNLPPQRIKVTDSRAASSASASVAARPLSSLMRCP